MSGAPPSPVILIHGAWQGAWVWERFRPLLEAGGLAVDAVDLPGNGTDATPPEAVSLDLYVAFLGGAIDRLGGRATLVAHSGAGTIAASAAEHFPGKVAGIVYVAGMMLPSGTSYADLVAALLPEHPDAAGVAPHLVWSDDRLTSAVPPEVACRFFLHDAAPGDAASAAARLTPQPERGRAICASLTAERFGRVPRLYVEAAADRSILPAAQRRMQTLLPGAEIVRLPTGHVPHLVAPVRLRDALLPFLARCR